MLSQEDIFFFLEKIGFELRNQNIPVLNNITYYFPKILTKDEIINLKLELKNSGDSSEEEN